MTKAILLDVPPAEAVENFRGKGLRVGYDWRDTSAEEHLRSFTVAKAMDLDILTTIRGAVDESIAAGATFEDFRNGLEPTLQAKGWWGRKAVLDPVAGELRDAQLGSAHRLRTIFDTNLRMSYARGRWERIERQAAARPWLRYVAVRDARTRPAHLRWHGTLLPIDHPFWRTHYPPCGWFCRCTVMQLSDRDLEEFGYEPWAAPPAGWDATRPWLDRRNGRTIQVPVGIDPGFQHNTGLINAGEAAADRLIGKIDDAPRELAEAAIGEPWRTAIFREFLRAGSGGRRDIGDFPLAVLSAGQAAALESRSVAARLSAATAAKQGRHHPEIRPADYGLAAEIVAGGEWFEERPFHLVGFGAVGGRLWKAVVKVTRDRSRVYVVSLRRARPEQLEAARRELKKVAPGGSPRPRSP